jgi:glyoxylase-like metal-dependent hydrolase (beta-lactamase superfamily II)
MSMRIHLSFRRLAGAAAVCATLGAGAAMAQPSYEPALSDQLTFAQTQPNGGKIGDFQVIPLRSLIQVRGQPELLGESGLVTVQTGVYVLQGPDGNVTVQVGPEGAVVIDTQKKEHAQGLVDAIKRIIGPYTIRWVFVTNGDPDRAGAVYEVRRAGKQIFGGNEAANASDVANEAVYMAHENVLNRLSGVNGKDAAVDEALWPKETYAEDEYDFYLNGEGVQYFHVPNAHTDGDSIVFFRRSDVIAAGDLWDTASYPRIDLAHGGSIQGVLDGLNHVIALTIPGNKQEGGTLVVPGHGRPGDEAEVVEYRDMLTIIRDRIRDMAAKGMTLEQIKAAKPTYDYDGRYGSTTGPWTTDMFISAVYEGVKPQRPHRGRAAR